ncbi:hypothetical protein D0C36_22590 [Mucilaginibacter conchicola]|uniref:Uncharacterized protein n=1 Tax=Mucilaginibacter conchicola TaxID=2303333 RepID=A0A372NMF8_9SPHI|nr:hypothetical protein D0C36_22590 [Mucilaginibacter conchicola]
MENVFILTHSVMLICAAIIFVAATQTENHFFWINRRLRGSVRKTRSLVRQLRIDEPELPIKWDLNLHELDKLARTKHIQS